MQCRDWDIDVLDPNCISKALIFNLWRTAADLINVTQDDMKTILVAELNKHLNSKEHSLQDLSNRLTNI